MFDLSGKTAVVTGGGSGIGQAICVALAQQGATVHILDLTAEKGAETQQQIEAQGGEAYTYAANVADLAMMQGVMEAIATQGETIDILVNNAGIAHIGTIEDTNEADFDKVFAVNVKGVFFGMQAAIPFMKEKGGSIINMASIAATIALEKRFAYSMSKGAALMMTHSAAKDLLPYNIRVNAISPARVHTPFVDHYLKTYYPGQESEMFAKLSTTQPIGRMGKPAEIAAMVVYLASDEAAFVTGSNFPIDGGFITLKS
ncbi:MAG: SDR family oxidoreductase [Bacteroidota bacterium]